MPTLDDRIDEIYKAPLQEFVTARTALAKSLTGADAARVKGLQKPVLAAWAVNQVYWRSRSVFDRLLKAGEKLRAAQVAAVEGKAADVRGLTQAHRQALSEAVNEASKAAREAGADPDTDQMARTLETLSLAPQSGDRPGRLIKPLAPAGFEALGGIAVRDRTPGEKPIKTPQRTLTLAPRPVPRPPAPTAEERLAEQRRAEAAKKAEADARLAAAVLRKAEADVAHAEAVEERARTSWEAAKQQLDEAKQALKALKATQRASR